MATIFSAAVCRTRSCNKGWYRVEGVWLSVWDGMGEHGQEAWVTVLAWVIVGDRVLAASCQHGWLRARGSWRLPCRYCRRLLSWQGLSG